MPVKHSISIEELHQMDREQRAALPKPQACHNCDTLYIGVKCRACGEYRPAYIALTKPA